MTRICGGIVLIALSLGACSREEAPSNEAPDSGAPSAPSENDAGISDERDANIPDADRVDLCPDGFPRGTPGNARLVAKLASPPEGIAVCPNGDVFVSIPDEAKILRVPLDGNAPELWATLAGRQPLGMDCLDGTLFVVDFRSNDAAVLRIAAKGAQAEALPPIEGGTGYSALNGIVAIKGRGIYVSDASNTPFGRIVLFTETAPGKYVASVAKSGIAFPNGLAFDSKAETLDVALTLQSQVLAFTADADAGLGTGKVTWSGVPLVDSIDGIAIDEHKALYVAHNPQGYVGRTSDDSKLATMKEPKSLAFRGGVLLITGAEGLYGKPLGICGVER